MKKEDLDLFKNCKTKEEALELVKKQKIKLDDDDLESISGGDYFGDLWDKLKKVGKDIVDDVTSNQQVEDSNNS